MAHIALNDAARAILKEVKNLIANEPEIKEEKLGMGRVYGGVVLTKIDELKSELEIEGYKCNIFHFLRGANVRNPTTRLLLIPINGKATLSKGEPLVQEEAYFIEDKKENEDKGNAGDNRVPLFGNELDVIIAVLKADVEK
ncbi:uncharacterized protein NFIA_030970 [Aspergillus fischeri NRRL 181]|uniref:Uncharacterized protein n=1 Tax=Neosartorya fischeri (strain ATCC 1020 / DSM 3700 / CBS 544.65 / FGSC A1164 / JCM 1740 / NRRL 181 / WB 181) TaxID=331117 RepID=A1DA33_NEOFI|nr:uncharacterized protein NFIA_030970 [Aspergillus fischeri NRRL 181]EAW20664.1 hypothetical protein NFIA_030970 [Aspergillus fischeri NRRL 181]